MKLRIWMAALLLAGVVGGVGAVEAGTAAADEVAAGGSGSCVLDLVPVDVNVGVPDLRPVRVEKQRCFPSLSVALGFVNGDLIGGGSGGGGSDPGADRTVIGIDWESPGFNGQSLVWTVGGDQQCTPGAGWYINAMPSGWNDRVSSAQSFAGCNHYPHYVFEGNQGSLHNCPCASMDVLDNETSSEKWFG